MKTARDAIVELSTALGGGAAATLAASALIEADVLGMSRFGISMLDEWSVDAVPVQMDAPSRALGSRDCAGCFAPLAVAGATLEMAGAAQKFGISAIFLRGVRGFGRLAPFVRHLADAGLVGLVGAEGPPFVAPHGGAAPVIGTNPLALAMGQGDARVVIDIASSTTTMADVGKARAAGTSLPDGIALDGAGRPTTIAAEVAALLPRGGQIGSLLGLMVELMAGVAGGGRGDPKGRGVFILAFDPAVAGEGSDWQEKLALLQGDWTTGGGHWPRGGGLPPGAVLDTEFVRRFDDCLARMSAAAKQ